MSCSDKFFMRFVVALVCFITSATLFAQDEPTVLVNTPQAERTFTGVCETSLIAGTNFSSDKIEGEYSYSINDISYIETGNSSITLSGDLTYSPDFGNFHQAQSQWDYAIVSNPNVLNADYDRKADGKNRLVIAPGKNPSAAEYVMFTYKINNLKIGSNVKLTFNVEQLNKGCVPVAGGATQTEFIIRANSGTQVFGPIYYGNNEVINGMREFNFEDLRTASLTISFVARFFNTCDAVAFSDIKIYGCVNTAIVSSDNSNSTCEGGFINLYAQGFNGNDGDYVWEHAREASGPWTKLSSVSDKIMVEVPLGSNYFRVTCNGMQAETEIMGIVCCAEDGSQDVIFREDFGTTTQRTNNEIVDKIGTYTYQPEGKVFDNYYCVVSNLDQADPGACGWPGNKTDHTGNENGAFLVINAGDKQTLFYERELGSDFCENTYYNMSLYAANITTAQWAPAEFMFEVVVEGTNEVLNQWYTGEILDYSEDGIPLKWHRYGFSFVPPDNTPLLLRIYSTSPETEGNDFAIDDIVVTTCKPEVSLYADYANGKLDAVGECNQPITLTAVPSGNIFTIFPNPYYLWQISDDGETWETLTQGDNLTEVDYAPRNGYPKLFRVIVAQSKDIAKDVANGDEVERCGIYIITNTAKLSCESDECPYVEKPVPAQEKYVYCKDSELPVVKVFVTEGCHLAWYADEYLVELISDDSGFSPNTPGLYYVVAVLDDSECVSEPVLVEIEELPLPSVSIVSENDATALTCDLQEIELTAVADNVDYLWTEQNQTDSHIIVDAEGLYVVEVKDIDTGCSNYASMMITDERNDCEDEPEIPDEPNEPDTPDEPVQPDEPESGTLPDIKIPIYFTPNGDGMSDIWEIENIEHYPDAVILIYDRHSRLLRRYNGNAKGWDGTYNGHPMPMDDYWYVVSHPQFGIKSGHFTLKR